MLLAEPPKSPLRQRLNQLLEQSEPKNLPRKAKIALYLIFSIIVVLSLHWSLATSDFGMQTQNTPTSLWGNLKNIFWSRNALAGEDQDRINLLLLGMGGVGHDGPFLTDTILLASLKPSTGKLTLLSIPRDLLVNIPEVGYRRINEANAIGEKVNPSSGPNLARQTLEKFLQLNIPYYVRVDFSGFAKVIDDLGGVTLTVEQGFTDTQYPTDDFKTKTIAFEPGTQHFNGDEALKFVRSRHGSNGEASDFARSRRQTQLILALKEKLLSRATLLNPSNVFSAFSDLSSHLATNLQTWQILRLGKLASKIQRDQVSSIILDDGPTGYLREEILIDGAFVLLPKDNSLTEIRDLAAGLVSQATTNSPSQNARLIIQNGTDINGLALATAEWLKDQGFMIVRYGNAPTKGYGETLIFDLSSGKKQSALRLLEEQLSGKLGVSPPATEEPADFLIILGPPKPEHPLSVKSLTT